MFIRVTLELDDGTIWTRVVSEYIEHIDNPIYELTNNSGIVSVKYEVDAGNLQDWTEIQ